MGKFKPLIAMLATVALALGILLIANLFQDPVQPENTPADNAPEQKPPAPTGLKYEIVTLDDRPELEPEDLWPLDGQRMASMDFWVLWKTFEFSDCRLLCTKDNQLWYDLGRTGSRIHYALVDLTFFDGRVTFAVDFTHEGRKVRSRPRTVSFGKGACFAMREHPYRVAAVERNTFDITLENRDPARLSGDDFRVGWFPLELVVSHSPQPGSGNGGVVKLGVENPQAVPPGGCVGWFQVFDSIAGTHDRTLVRLSPPR